MPRKKAQQIQLPDPSLPADPLEVMRKLLDNDPDQIDTHTWTKDGLPNLLVLRDRGVEMTAGERDLAWSLVLDDENKEVDSNE